MYSGLMSLNLAKAFNTVNYQILQHKFENMSKFLTLKYLVIVQQTDFFGFTWCFWGEVLLRNNVHVFVS